MSEWNQGISEGLLQSLCFFPILSYGAMAPLATKPQDTRWAAEPLGLQRLEGKESDREDGLLQVVSIWSWPRLPILLNCFCALPEQELLVASVLLDLNSNSSRESRPLTKNSPLVQV